MVSEAGLCSLPREESLRLEEIEEARNKVDGEAVSKKRPQDRQALPSCTGMGITM